MKKQASVDQIFQAFCKLTKGQRSRLEKVASFYCRATSFSEPSDLLHEVLLKALEKERRWCLDVRFTSFMCNAIRSVADADRQLHDHKACSLSDYGDDDGASMRVHFEENGPSEEDRMLMMERVQSAARVIAYARAILVNDPLANLVLDGIVAERSRKQTCEALHIPVKTYVAARERVKRAISKARNRYDGVPLGRSASGRSLRVRCEVRARQA
ncbi:hypothetical protein [Robbsia sp. KACC 23696]|uniref:hypothetical protein n=1 Tax=Robbsia sp. KACC 23696 TaxID=3149231 RepID=UPI00325AAC07